MIPHMKFNPLESGLEQQRAEFWDIYSKQFASLAKAPSSLLLLSGSIELCNKHLRREEGGGKFLKLDLWDEAHHTATLSHIWQNYDEVHAIDLSPDVVAKAIARLKTDNIPVRGVVGDMRAMPYQTDTFDFIFTMGTIEHIPKPIEAMREIYRVLKPGGRAVIGVPYKYEWFGKSIALDIFAYLGIKSDGREFSFGWRQLSTELGSCGFRIEDRDGPYFIPWIIRAMDWFFAQNMPRLCLLVLPLVKICGYLSKYKYLRSHSSQIVAIVEKPFLDSPKAVELAKKFGTPLFVTNRSTLVKNVARFKRVFKDYAGGFTLCYSAKTNSQLEILRTMRQENVVAEVCSRLDMSGALKAGYNGKEMIYEGLTKTNHELTLALDSDVRIINIESMDEAIRLEELARSKNCKVDVGIRLAFPSKTGVKSLLGVTYDRFGASVINGEALRIAKFINESKCLKLIGLHCHTGSNQRSVEKYLVGVDLITEFMKLIKDKFSIDITLINLGGGIGLAGVRFYSIIDLGVNFIRNLVGLPIHWNNWREIDFNKIAEAIKERLRERLREYNLKTPHLMMEPGRALVGDSTDLLLGVVNTKKTDTTNWIILDGGTNLLPVLTLFSEYHSIEICVNQTHRQKISVAGPLLYSADILASNRLLPPAKIGDLAIIRDVGAYCIAQSNQFLYPRAATVFLANDNEYIIQRRETLEDVYSRDVTTD